MPPAAILPCLVEKATPVDRAVHVRVEENEQILIELASRLAIHARLLVNLPQHTQRRNG